MSLLTAYIHVKNNRIQKNARIISVQSMLLNLCIKNDPLLFFLKCRWILYILIGINSEKCLKFSF